MKPSKPFQSAIETIAAEIIASDGDQFAAIRQTMLLIEARVVRAAMERASWNMNRAQRELGLRFINSVTQALRRHPDIEAERKRRVG